jgi:hypothetical protein
MHGDDVEIGETPVAKPKILISFSQKGKKKGKSRAMSESSRCSSSNYVVINRAHNFCLCRLCTRRHGV